MAKRNGSTVHYAPREAVDLSVATSFLLPQDKDAEQAVLGSMLRDPAAIPIVQAVLKGGDEVFVSEKRRWIYRAILSLERRMSAVGKVADMGDALLMIEELRRIDAPTEGPASVTIDDLADCVMSVPSAMRAEHYAKIVQERYLSRALLSVAYEVIMQARHQDGQLADWLAFLTTRVAEITSGTQTTEPITLASSAAEVFSGLEDGTPRADGLGSGWRSLDKTTGGWHGGELVVIAARPGVGKTSVLVNLAERILYCGGRVLFFSLEMSHTHLTQRIVSLLSQVPVRAFFARNLSGAQAAATRAARQLIDKYGARLLVDEDSSVTIEDIRARAAVQHTRTPLTCVMVDYLQLVRSSGNYDRRDLEVAAVARGLKALAKDLKLPVFATAQTRRETDDGGEPKLRDLRESGDIESAADMVIFIQREPADPESGNPNYANERAVLTIAKHRHGPTGKVELLWSPSNMELFEAGVSPLMDRNKDVAPPSLSDWATNY